MCRCSPLFVVGVLVLVIASVACALGYVAPFWMLYDESIASAGLKFSQLFTAGGVLWTEGLWAYCYPNKECYWYLQDDFKVEKGLPDYHKAVQGVYGAGLLLMIVALLIGLIQMLCCCCCKESPSVNSALGSLSLSGAIMVAAAIGVWGGYIKKEYRYDLMTFYWAFYVAIASAVIAIVAAILFFCEGCRARTYTGYHMTRVV